MSKDKLSQEQICVEAVNKAPEAEKKSVFEKACALVKNKTKVAALALSLGIGGPALASTPAPQETQKVEQTQEFFQGFDENKLPEEFKNGVNLTKLKYKEKVETSKVNFPLRIELTSGKESDIVNNLPLAPKKTFKELTGYDNFSFKVDIPETKQRIDTYSITINSLYDLSDLKTWYRIGTEKRLPTDEELKAYVVDKVGFDKPTFDKLGLKYDEKEAKEFNEKVANGKIQAPEKIRWLGKYNDWKKEALVDKTLDTKVLDDAITLFNEGIKNLSVQPSREAYRRLLVDSFSMAYLKNLKIKNLNIKDIQRGSDQVGEYVQLTDKNSEILKIGFGVKNVESVSLFASKTDVNENIVLKNYPFFENFGKDSLKGFTDEMNQKFDLVIADIKNDKSEKELTQSEKELTQSEKELTQSEKILKQAEDVGKIGDEIDSKCGKAFILLQEFAQTKDKSKLVEIEKLVNELQKYKKIIDEKINSDIREKDKENYKSMITYIQSIESKFNESKKLG